MITLKIVVEIAPRTHISTKGYSSQLAIETGILEKQEGPRGQLTLLATSGEDLMMNLLGLIGSTISVASGIAEGQISNVSTGVLFENVRVFDGTSKVLSEPSNVL